MCWWFVKVSAKISVNLVARARAEITDTVCKVLHAAWGGGRRSDNDVHVRAVWFRKIQRLESEAFLVGQDDGSFVVRPSSKVGSVCTLSVIHEGRVYHISVRRRPDRLLSLGTSKPNERCFRNVAEIIEFYSSEPLLVLSEGNSVVTLLRIDE